MEAQHPTRTNEALLAHVAANGRTTAERFDYDEADRLSRLAGEAHAAWLAAAAIWRLLPPAAQYASPAAGAKLQQLYDATHATRAAVNAYYERTNRPYAVVAEVFTVQAA